MSHDAPFVVLFQSQKEEAARGRKVQRGQGTPLRRSRSLDDEEEDDDDDGGVLVEQAESGADSKGDDDCSEEDVEEEAEEEVSALLGCFGPRCPFALPGILTRSPHLLLFAACCSSWAWTGNAPSSSSSQQQRSRAFGLACSGLIHFAARLSARSGCTTRWIARNYGGGW